MSNILTDLKDYRWVVEEDVAKQCYLECLAVECGEGECAKSIRTKFKLDVGEGAIKMSKVIVKYKKEVNSIRREIIESFLVPNSEIATIDDSDKDEERILEWIDEELYPFDSEGLDNSEAGILFIDNRWDE